MLSLARSHRRAHDGPSRDDVRTKPRLFAMARDGLLPPSFSRVHPSLETRPVLSTVLFALFIALDRRLHADQHRRLAYQHGNARGVHPRLDLACRSCASATPSFNGFTLAVRTVHHPDHCRPYWRFGLSASSMSASARHGVSSRCPGSVPDLARSSVSCSTSFTDGTRARSRSTRQPAEVRQTARKLAGAA